MLVGPWRAAGAGSGATTAVVARATVLLGGGSPGAGVPAAVGVAGANVDDVSGTAVAAGVISMGAGAAAGTAAPGGPLDVAGAAVLVVGASLLEEGTPVV